MQPVCLLAALSLLPAHRPRPYSGARVRSLWMAQDDGNAADDLNSAFAARLRAVSGSDKPSELRASEQAAAMRAKAEAARRRADSVKSDAADFLAGGKKQVAAGRGYDGDDLAEVRRAHSDTPVPAARVHAHTLLTRLLVGSPPALRPSACPFRSSCTCPQEAGIRPPFPRLTSISPALGRRCLGTTRAT
jgi:hypothetical protein